MIRLSTKDEERLVSIQAVMDSVQRYSEEWFTLKKQYVKLFEKIEKERGMK